MLACSSDKVHTYSGKIMKFIINCCLGLWTVNLTELTELGNSLFCLSPIVQEMEIAKLQHTPEKNQKPGQLKQ